jgi:hypothetical protein
MKYFIQYTNYSATKYFIFAFYIKYMVDSHGALVYKIWHIYG